MLSFVDLKAGYLELEDDLDAAMRRVLESGRYRLAPELEAFEQEFAAHCGALRTASASGAAPAR